MSWEQWYCPNQDCHDGAWMVQHDPRREVWWVAAHTDDRPFMVAAIDPVCPHCGTTLLAMVELEGGLAGPAGIEVESVFDFVRSLT